MAEKTAVEMAFAKVELMDKPRELLMGLKKVAMSVEKLAESMAVRLVRI